MIQAAGFRATNPDELADLINEWSRATNADIVDIKYVVHPESDYYYPYSALVIYREEG